MHHDSRIFSKLLPVLHLDRASASWGFLKAFKGKGALQLTRQSLAERVSVDPSAAGVLGDLLFKSVEFANNHVGSSKLPVFEKDVEAKVSWYASIMSCAVDCKVPSETFLRTVAPQLLRGFALQAHPSLQVCSLYFVDLLNVVPSSQPSPPHFFLFRLDSTLWP